jgi:hypothetical protein
MAARWYAACRHLRQAGKSRLDYLVHEPLARLLGADCAASIRWLIIGTI